MNLSNKSAREGTSRAVEDTGSSPYFQALRFLERKPRSCQEIYQRLLLKGFDASEIHETLERLKDMGLLDDRQFAVRYAEEIFSKGYGTLKIRRKLAEKGVKRDIIEETIAEFSDLEKERAKEVLRTQLIRKASKPEEISRKKLLIYLSRRGFSEESSIAAVEGLEASLDF